jgi:hypothetical protein
MRAVYMLLGVSLLALPARAAPPDKAACLSAYEEGQRARLRAELRLARERLLVCARDPCPATMHAECAEWLRDVDRRMPSVVVEASYSDGTLPAQARLFFDGALLGNALEGRAFDVEPGTHTFRLEAEKGEPVEQKFLVLEGDKARKVRFVIELPKPAQAAAAPERPAPVPAAAPPLPPPARPIPWTTYVFGAAGAVALGSFAFFGARGVAQRSDLDTCKGSCAASDVDPVRQKFVAADVSLAIGAVCLGLATYFFVTRPEVRER